jgi:gamma-glutamylcyclotransferase (GGCT)/AIG2-like uncharacterized protein YtfP
VAVYGTLRPGCGNDRLWQGSANVIADGWFIAGYRLVSNGAFPYAIPTGDRADESRVTLVMPHLAEYDEVLARLDMLEGVPTHYVRSMVECRDPEDRGGGFVVAWLYEPAHPEFEAARCEPVPANDWYQRPRYVDRWLDTVDSAEWDDDDENEEE